MAEPPAGDEAEILITPHAAAHCGQCGYDVRGLPLARCPECGSDLREVGIFERPRFRAPAMLRAFYFLLVFVPVAAILRVVLIAVMPNVFTEDAQGLVLLRLDREHVIGGTYSMRASECVWPLSPGPPGIEPTWELTLAVVDAPTEVHDHGDHQTVDGQDIRAATLGSDAVAVTLRADGAASLDTLAQALQQLGVQGDATVKADNFFKMLQRLESRERRSSMWGRMDDWHPGGSSSSGGGGWFDFEVKSTDWIYTETARNARLHKYGPANAVVTAAFVLIGLFGLYLAAIGVDLRPQWMRDRARENARRP